MATSRGSGIESRLMRGFFTRDAEAVAQDLIGKIMVHRVGGHGGRELRARIVETEAYVGEHDLACHAAKGRTKRTEVMYGEGGHAYVYFIYGMHEMFNVVTGHAGSAQAVLIRAAEALHGFETADRKLNLSGPGRFAKGMGITRKDYGLNLTGDKLFFVDDGWKGRIRRGVRIGVDYSGDWKHELLRFWDASSRAVSKPVPRE
ncbi:MAG TPA: DNA-3-methyladenine glycosylase [Phycisphaerae bacterium]|nr:DNA-3-methyladenine glycosylase [Phycisphaerae bacterium]